MFDFFRELIVLPLRLLVFIGSYMKIAALYSLRKQVWLVTRSFSDAAAYAVALYTSGVENARNTIREMLNGSASGYVHAHLITLDYRVTRQRDWAEAAVAQSSTRDLNDKHMLLYARLFLEEDRLKIKALSEEILSRNDIPGYVSTLAYYNLCIYHLEQGDTAAAKPIIDFCLQVDENPNMRIASMAHSILTGKDDLAEQAANLQRKHKDSPKFATAQAYLFAGDPDSAIRHLEECSTQFLAENTIGGGIKLLVDAVLQKREKQSGRERTDG